MVCNRVRTAKLINGYLPEIKELPSKYFVTLTIPNVGYLELSTAIDQMIKQCTLINRHIREKRALSFKGIRKIECTYNADRNDYHPHFHIIVDSHAVAELFVSEWLQRYPKAKMISQDIREADDGAVLELFKYFTKVIASPKKKTTTQRMVYTRALDTIFRAMVGKRVFQPMGIKKVSEDVDPTLSEIFDIEETDGDVWVWLASDWVSTDTGELLTNHVPSEALQNLKFNL